MKKPHVGLMMIAGNLISGTSPELGQQQKQQPYPTPPQQQPYPTPPQQQPPYPTPSPFTSSRWSSRPSIYHVSGLVLRSLVLLFSFASMLSLATQSHRTKGKQSNTFVDYNELLYCFVVAILAFSYTVVQLFKNICDIVPTGNLIPNLISNKISDYFSFICDQLMSYLLISSSTMVIPLVTRMKHDGTLWKAAAISASMSLATFVVMAICALLSGYKLCKTIIW